MHLTNWFAYQCDISTALTSHIGRREVMSHSEPQTTNMHNINIMPMWHFCHCSPSHIYCTMYLFWEYKQWNKQNNDNVDRYLTHTNTHRCPCMHTRRTHTHAHTHTHTHTHTHMHTHTQNRERHTRAQTDYSIPKLHQAPIKMMPTNPWL